VRLPRRVIPMPPVEAIIEIGKTLITLNNFSLRNINNMVNVFFEFNETAIE
jgi:hypothetical protein